MRQGMHDLTNTSLSSLLQRLYHQRTTLHPPILLRKHRKLTLYARRAPPKLLYFFPLLKTRQYVASRLKILSSSA